MFFLGLAVMVDKEVVLTTIRKMLDAGLDDSVISTTLADVGLTSDEVKMYLGQAKKPLSPVPSQPASPSSGNSGDSSSASPSVSNPLAEENALLHETTQSALNEHSESLGEITDQLSRIENLLTQVSKLPIAELNAKIGSFDKKISDNTREIADVKAQTSALREILEKVLETDRDTLLELQKKKQ